MSFPTALDNGTTLPNPSSSSATNNPSHSSLHASENGAIIAIETKLGTGSSTPASNTLLFGTGAGTSAWQTLTSSQLASVLSDETGTGSAVFANTPTLITPKVDTINENTLNNGVTVGGVSLKAGVISTSGAVTNTALASGSVKNANLATTTGELGGAWQSYTPTFTNFTIGNAVMTAKNTQIGKTVIARGTVTLGTTSSMGTALVMTLPVTSNSDYSIKSVLGIGDTLRTGTADYLLSYYWATTTTVTMFVWNAASTYLTLNNVTSTAPGTWGTGDIFTWKIEYEAA